MPAYTTQYERFRLDNGMELVVASRPWSSSFAALLSIRVGWRDEQLSQTGITHLAEHLCFCGKNRQLSEQFARQGLHVNGQTDSEQTQFILAGHASLMPESMELFANMLAQISADERTIAEELEIMGHEMAMGQEAPLDQEMRKLTARIIGDKDFARPLSTHSNMLKMTPSDVAQFHQRWFSPGNACLTLVSPAAPQETLELAQRAFGAIPARPVPGSQRRIEKQKLPPLIAVNGGGDYIMTLLMYPIQPVDKFPLHALVLLNDALGGGPHSEMFRIIRTERRMAYTAGSSMTNMSDCLIPYCYAIIHRKQLLPALEEMLKITGRYAKEGISADDFIQTRQRLVRWLDVLEDNPSELCGFLASSPLRGEPVPTPGYYRQQLEQLTPEAMNAISREVVAPARRLVVLMGPVGWIAKWRAKRLIERMS